MAFFLVRSDITKIQADAIVNAANTELLMGGGVCGAIFKAAGVEDLQNACAALAPIDVGTAVHTPAFKLPAKYVIHTAGPIYHDGKHNEERLLSSCYTNSLQLAQQLGCRSIAFPLISSGIYRYPKKEALEVAKRAILNFLEGHDMDINLVLYDETSYNVSQNLLLKVQQYLDQEFYIEPDRVLLALELCSLQSSCVETKLSNTEESIAKALQELDQPFSETLRQLIKERGKTEVEVYKKANLDRKHFSKIRTGNGYVPSKRTILALAIALELDLEQANTLLAIGGYALSHANKADVIIEFFLKERQYDLFAINEVLFSYDQPLLGC
jgi:O-acetyl-ADP-ribose deacetylase (regulator of RNase III)/transcriptional regulator with XRE-family HTH domain